MYLEGKGQEAIARHLDKEKYPTPGQVVGRSNAGWYWQSSTVKKILMNYHYLGHLVQNRETSVSTTSKNREMVSKDEMIWVRDTHEAIIDETTFNLVQEKLALKTHGGKGKTTRYTDNRHLFTGFIFCSECGSPYWWRGNCKGYLCRNRLRRGKEACSNDIIREQHLISIIKRDVKAFLKESNINIDIDKKLQKEQKKNEKKISSLTNKIDNLKRKKKLYLDEMLDSNITRDEYKFYVEDTNKQIEKNQKELDLLSIEAKKERLDISSIKSQLQSILELETIDRELINLLINRIEISKNGELKVFYTFSSSKVYNRKLLKSIS